MENAPKETGNASRNNENAKRGGNSFFENIFETDSILDNSYYTRSILDDSIFSFIQLETPTDQKNEESSSNLMEESTLSAEYEEERKLKFRVKYSPEMEGMSKEELGAYCLSKITGLSYAETLGLMDDTIVLLGDWIVDEEERKSGQIEFYVSENLYYELTQSMHEKKSSSSDNSNYSGVGDIPSASKGQQLGKGTSSSYAEPRDENQRRTGAKKRDEEYSKLPSDQKHDVTQEANKRFYDRLGIDATKRQPQIYKEESTEVYQELWKDTRDEVMIDKDQIEALPERVLKLLPQGPPPKDFSQFKRIAEKLNSLDDEKLDAISKMFVPASGEDYNLDQTEAFVDNYIANNPPLNVPAKKDPAASPGKPVPNEKSLEEKINEYWQTTDMSGWENATVGERKDLARQKMSEVEQIELQHMYDNPGETIDHFAESVTLANTDQVVEGVIKDGQEIMDENSTGTEKMAAGAGMGSKISAQAAAALGVLMFLVALTGVGALAELAAYAVALIITSIVLSQIEAELRLEAAANESTQEGFADETTDAANAQLSAHMGMAFLVLGMGFKFLFQFKFKATIESIKIKIGRIRSMIGALKETDPVPEHIRVAMVEELSLTKTELIEMKGKAKGEIPNAVNQLEGLTAETFVERLESGDKGLLELTGIAEKDIPAWREVLNTKGGKSSIEKFLNGIKKSLVEEVPAQIDAIVDPLISDLDAFMERFANAETVAELRNELAAYEHTFSEQAIAERLKLQQENALKQHVENVLKEMESEKQQSLTVEEKPPVNEKSNIFEEDGNLNTTRGRVEKAGGQTEKYKTFDDDSKVPVEYSNNPEFRELSTDPAHLGKKSITPATRQEAMAGLEAESQGLIKGPIERGPKEIEFYDANGSPYDVKTPPSKSLNSPVEMNHSEAGGSILKELRMKLDVLNKKTGIPEKRRVILDCTYMTEADHRLLWDWLNENLTPEEISRIVEVNVKI